MITTRAREGGPKEHRAKQKWQRETRSVTYVPGLSTLSDLSRINTQPHRHSSVAPRPPSHHPSSLTSVSLVPAFHLLPLPTPFWPYDTHPFFPHDQTISILSDLLYSLTPFLKKSKMWNRKFPSLPSLKAKQCNCVNGVIRESGLGYEKAGRTKINVLGKFGSSDTNEQKLEWRGAQKSWIKNELASGVDKRVLS